MKFVAWFMFRLSMGVFHVGVMGGCLELSIQM
jgi:hypothetical protein